MNIFKKEKLKILLIAFIAIFGLLAISANTNVKASEDVGEKVFENEDISFIFDKNMSGENLYNLLINNPRLKNYAEFELHSNYGKITVEGQQRYEINFEEGMFIILINYENSVEIEEISEDFPDGDILVNVVPLDFWVRTKKVELDAGWIENDVIISNDFTEKVDLTEYSLPILLETTAEQIYVSFLNGGNVAPGIVSSGRMLNSFTINPNQELIGETLKIYEIKKSSEITEPIITGNLEKETVSYTETFNVDNFVESLEISSLDFDFEDLTIAVEETYTANKNQLGIYEIQVSVTDPIGNTTIATKEIEVKDLVKPVISGINSYIKSTANIVAASDIIEGIVANDHIDGKVDVKVHSDTFTGKGNIAGNYLIVVSATDKAGNRALHEIDVKVVNYILDDSSNENVNNWNITNDKIVNLPVNTKFTRVNIIELLNRVELINAPANSIITYDLDTYTENIGEPGIYTLEFNVKQPNGTSHDHTFTVNIGNYAPGQDSDVIEDVPFNLFDWLDDNGKKMLIWTLVIVAVGGGVYLFIRFRK